VQALQLMLERSGATGGFLYSVADKGDIVLQAAAPDEKPPAELEAALEAYLQAELDDTSDVTLTCFDEPATASTLGAASAYQPVLLWSAAEGSRTITGIVALRCEREHFTAPSWDLLAAVSEILGARGEEVVSIVG
jgi:hypothetical protein